MLAGKCPPPQKKKRGRERDTHTHTHTYLHASDRGVVFLANEFRYPPVVFLLVVADGDGLRAATQGELVFLRAPLHAQGCPVEVRGQDRHLRLPLALLLRLLPDVSVPIVRARHYEVFLGRPVNSTHELLVLLEGRQKLVSRLVRLIDVNLVGVRANGNFRSRPVPRVARYATRVRNLLLRDRHCAPTPTRLGL